MTDCNALKRQEKEGVFSVFHFVKYIQQTIQGFVADYYASGHGDEVLGT